MYTEMIINHCIVQKKKMKGKQERKFGLQSSSCYKYLAQISSCSVKNPSV